jgi:hypothetical protein
MVVCDREDGSSPEIHLSQGVRLRELDLRRNAWTDSNMLLLQTFGGFQCPFVSAIVSAFV